MIYGGDSFKGLIKTNGEKPGRKYPNKVTSDGGSKSIARKIRKNLINRLVALIFATERFIIIKHFYEKDHSLHFVSIDRADIY